MTREQAREAASDTPRTDAHIEGLRRNPEVSGCNRTLDFARDIERELNAANQHIKRLEEAYSASEALHTVRDCACCDSPDVWIRCGTCCDKIKRYHAANFNLNRTEETKESKP